MKRLLPAAMAAMLIATGAKAGTRADTTAAAKSPAPPAQADTMPQRRSLGKRVADYFRNANKGRTDKKFDFSIIGGPHYNTNTQLGLGLVAAGLYSADRRDTTLMPSNVSLFGDVSTVGFYMLGVRGLHVAPHDRYRIDYTLYFYSFPSKFWGLGYDMGNDDANESDMNRFQAQAKASFLWRVAPNLYFGPMAAYDFVRGYDFERPELIEGMDTRTNNFGLGLTLMYDTRDVATNPHRGFYVNIEQCFRPRFLGNDYCFSTTELRADAYTPAWRGATIAADVRSTLNFGNPSWAMMAKLGGPYSMRGYYEGRYRDKHKVEAQVELRQHVWRRHGVVVWVGAGTVFSKFSQMRMAHVLPNCGLGYRWEFKKNVNVRLDYGFGKGGQSGFMFNINEAF